MANHASYGRLNAGLISACLTGLGLAYYAYVVETAKEKDNLYEAMCDISEHVSCTKAFMSKYGKGFGLIPKDSILYAPNSIYGLIFYFTVLILSTLNYYSSTLALLALGILANISSVYLACILYLLNDICIVCVSNYIVNAIILILTVKKLRIVSRGETRKKKTK
ncbi:vitamin K epoxide reductase complex subunit 1-like protein 1 [Cephus cinctus]|uniref:vitamin-K-epoxide reductase (warfarin-sensitive) n=1 Tax=Cephus cinctus TaxID=211228 RepID=A0AAJ7CAI1_CEPCN|nr:vitamin K epoxide reductase complex subunit 1-like protein 1 [Cephus cinctus]